MIHVMPNRPLALALPVWGVQRSGRDEWSPPAFAHARYHGNLLETRIRLRNFQIAIMTIGPPLLLRMRVAIAACKYQTI